MVAHVIIKRCGCKPISENCEFDASAWCIDVHNFPRENPDCASLRRSTPKQEISIEWLCLVKKDLTEIVV